MHITAVMATMPGRKHFLRKSIEYWNSQTYTDRDLIIVDDDPDSWQPPDGITYIQLGSDVALSDKLNIAIEAAKGPLIQKLDDDDYYAPGFMSAMYEGSRVVRQDNFIGGMNSALLYLSETGELKFTGYGWFLVATLLFPKEVWLKKPFREDVRVDSERMFIEDHPEVDKYYVNKYELFMIVRHTVGHLWTSQWGSDINKLWETRNKYERSLEEYLPKHASFYRSLNAKVQGSL